MHVGVGGPIPPLGLMNGSVLGRPVSSSPHGTKDGGEILWHFLLIALCTVERERETRIMGYKEDDVWFRFESMALKANIGLLSSSYNRGDY